MDVAVDVDPATSRTYPFGYAADLSTALMQALPGHTIDVVVLNEASPLLYHRVLRDGVRVLSRHLQNTTTREGYALSRYCDWVPQMEKIAAAHDARIARGEFGR